MTQPTSKSWSSTTTQKSKYPPQTDKDTILTKRDTFIIGVDNAVKDNDLDALYEYAENFDENDYPEEIGYHHHNYIWEAIELLKNRQTTESSKTAAKL
jgi:hypothetical protein